ncbi:peptide chain release factor N(5)-glutamine methyltransferase [Luteolibacter arcticus]|uniref:Release factor glutamine methyltransferase n=1 Tax=Luteolibacter arcticus TaxID=1581411 RepID=A0ABT3GH75_9BACT|nr:peptide chain release factor N(5)-glutamine methyltransferase [Luteolibacter arcticus]MCW1922966.1 peptide chain release factor N(5)-glutamine methyltransferase [Luteolibacter arcticus]
MTTVLETLDKGTAYLTKKGIEDARRNMQMLIAHQLSCTRMDLYLRFDQEMEETDLAPLRDLLKKRGEGVPIQHLLGSVTFHRRDFKTDARALIPRPETEELAEWLVKNAKLPDSPRILDMGCGTGVLGLTLAADFPNSHSTLADLSPDALSLARENAAELEITNVSFVESDLFAALGGQSFDLIVANLPYVPETDRPGLAKELAHDPDLALFGGPDGMDLIRRFIPEAAKRLNPGGWLALEIGIHQSGEVESLLHAASLTGVLTLKDLSGIPRFPVARRN